MTDEDGKTPLPRSQSYSYVSSTCDDENVGKCLPNHLIKPSKKGETHDIMIDANEEKNETGIECDSDCEAEEINDIDEELHLARLFKLASIADQDSNEDIELSDKIWWKWTLLGTYMGHRV